MIFAFFYLLIGLFASILIFIKRPKIEIQIPKEYEQLEKDIAEWLELPIIQTKEKIQMTTAFDAGLEPYFLEKPTTAISVNAFERADGLNIKEQVV